MTNEITTTAAAAESVNILATFIGKENANFFRAYFENGHTLTALTFDGHFMILDHTGMNVNDSFVDFIDAVEFCNAHGNGEKNIKKVMLAIAEKMVIG